MRRVYAVMAHIASLYGNDETEFSEKLNFVKPPIRRGETGGTYSSISCWLAARCFSVNARWPQELMQ